MSEIIETESGSLYKVELRADGWWIFMPQFKSWKKVSVLAKGKSSLEVEAKTKIQEFKGSLVWFLLEDKKNNAGNTTRVQKIYKEVA